MKGLFVNSFPAQCSIYESGLDIYACLSKEFSLDYIEETDPNKLNLNYDYIAVHFHHVVNHQLTRGNIKHPKVIAFNMEASPNNAYVYCPLDFIAVCIPDPTLIESPGIFAFPRPILPYCPPPKTERDKPWIGVYGFATPSKHCKPLVDAINVEFDHAVVRIHSPSFTYGDIGGNSSIRYTFSFRQLLKPTIDIQISHNYLSKIELLDWVSNNDVMCYHYYRDKTGPSAATDQAVVAEVPVSVNACDTFRHIHQYQAPYPELSIRGSMLDSINIKRMKHDWSPANFNKKFEEVLSYVFSISS